jgi:hypothetical protein
MLHRRRRWLLAAAVLILVTAAVLSARIEGRPSATAVRSEPSDGRDQREPTSAQPTIEASFAAESYRRGSTAILTLFGRASMVEIRLYRVGDTTGMLRVRDEMRGTPVGSTHSLARVTEGQTVRLRLDSRWPSGLYFAELTAPGGRVGYAPFVLAPQKLGGHRIAVVLPTQTWQAYNFRDDDGDGKADNWYAAPDLVSKVPLIRPFENRGVPPHYRSYDEPFLRWLARKGYAVDFLSDAELRGVRGSTLAGAYKLLIFEGHHEYVTAHEYDAVTGFRNRGGNLMFLSGNNFFRKITIADGLMTRVGQWRKLGRPEAALVGNRYFSSRSEGRNGSPWVVRNSEAGNWIFRDTGLEPGSLFASGGIEADSTSRASPRGIQVVAEIPNVFGDGRSAQMTYYEAPSGAKVFAAGAFTLAGSIWQPPVQQIVANLIEELSGPGVDVRRSARGT